MCFHSYIHLPDKFSLLFAFKYAVSLRAQVSFSLADSPCKRDLFLAQNPILHKHIMNLYTKVCDL